VKPFPIRHLERLKGGAGVIADDVGRDCMRWQSCAYSIYVHQILIMPGITIKNVAPKAALPAGSCHEYSGRELAGSARPEVRFGDFTAQVMMASSDHIIAKVPDSSSEIGTQEPSSRRTGYEPSFSV